MFPLLLAAASSPHRPVIVKPMQLLPHQLLMQQEVEESLLAARASDEADGAEPTTARAEWSRTAMVYLGQDRMHTYNQWSGEYGVFEYERNSLGKCDAFSWPPISTGRFEQLIGVEWVFLGFTKAQYLTQLVHLDPLTGRVELADCDESSFAADCDNKQLSCKPLSLANNVLPGRPGSVHELVYLGQARAAALVPHQAPLPQPAPLALATSPSLPVGLPSHTRSHRRPKTRPPPLPPSPPDSHPSTPSLDSRVPSPPQDLLLHYERTKGNYSLISYSRCSHDLSPGGCALSAPLAHGSLAPGEYHVYLGFDLLLSYAPREGGRYSVHRLFRGEHKGAVNGTEATGWHSPPNVSSAPRAAGLVQVATGTFSFDLSWSADPARHRFAALREGQLLDYDKEEGDYRVLQLDPIDMSDGMAGELRYTVASGGAGRVPIDASDDCSVHTTASACLQAAQLTGKCGWCQAAATCRRGDARGPCARGNCQAPPDGCGLWHTPAARVAPDNNGAGPGGDAAAGAAVMGGAGMTTLETAAAALLPSPSPSPDAATPATIDVPVAVPDVFTMEGSALYSLAAFALRELQRVGCAARPEASCDVLRDARLARVAAATSLVSYHANASVAAVNGAASELMLRSNATATTLAAQPADGVATVEYALQLALCTVDGGDAEDRLDLTVVEHVGAAGLYLARAAVRVLSQPMALPETALPLALDRKALEMCSVAPYCWPAGGACAPPAIAPPSFDAHEFTYLGYDALLDFAPVSGAMRVWQMDRRPSGAAPLLTPPLMSAVWGMPLRRFVFVGYDTWLDYSPGSGSYDLHRCEHERWQRGEPLLCARLCGGSCGVAPELQGEKQLLYLGHDRLLLFDTPSGGYTVLALRRTATRRATAAAQLAQLEGAAATAALAADGVGLGLGLRAPLETGALPEWAGRRLAYLGDELLLATEPLSGAYEWWLLNRANGTAAAAAGGRGGLLKARLSDGVWDAHTNGTRLVSLMEDRLLRAVPDPNGGFDYEFLQCYRPPCDAAGTPKGEVECKVLGSGELHEEAVAVPTALRGMSRGAGPRQQLLLESGAAGALGSRQLLDYEARTGRVRVLSIELTPLLTSPLVAASGDAKCDALPDPPLYSSAWPFENHRLTSLGNDTVLDVEPASGEFRVWLCRRDEFTKPAASAGPRAPGAIGAAVAAAARDDEPLPAPLPCDAVALGQWPALTLFTQAVWLGPLIGSAMWLEQKNPLDALLLWEPTSAKYEVWRLRRTGRRWLPSAVAKPLAAGVWDELTGYSLTFVGSSTLLALHPTTGRYELRMLDRGALIGLGAGGGAARRGGVPPPMETGLLAAGSLKELPRLLGSGAGAGGESCAFDFHQATALGDDLLLDLEPTTGEYCVLRLGRDQLAQQQPLTAVAAGNLLRRPCNHDRCDSCAAEPGCGWCSETATCHQGSALAPCGGGCHDHWTQGYCADWPCEHYSTCDDCLNTKLCGWCEGLQACMPGSDVQPLALSCPAGYSYQYCPAGGGEGSLLVGTSES